MTTRTGSITMTSKMKDVDGLKAEWIPVYRKATVTEASSMIGDTVPDRKANVKGPAVFTDAESGEVVAAYLPLENVSRIRRLLPKLTYGGLQRSNNYNSRSQTFGYQPRRPLRLRESCSTSQTTIQNPEIQAELDKLADQCARAMKKFAPEIVETDKQTLEDVLPEWKMGEEKLWTSGVINHTAQLPYHRDNFNYPVWSAMPVLRRGVRGGHLHIPEYDLVVPCQDSYALFFKGKEFVHGVTPMTKKQEDGYRFSIVFYALRGMKDCYTHAVETQYGQKKRSQREREIAKRLAAGDTAIPGTEGKQRRRKINEAKKAENEPLDQSDSSAELIDKITLPREH